MGKQSIGWFLLVMLSRQVIMTSINNVVANGIIQFNNISEAYLTVGAQQLYLVNENPATAQAQMRLFNINNGSLIASQSYQSQHIYSPYWQLQLLQTEIVSFSITNNQKIQFYTTSTASAPPIQLTSLIFRTIWSRSLGVIFYSTVGGSVGYSTDSQIKSGQLTFMGNSHHIGNTFLSLSPNQRFLCSSDMTTGLVSIWDASNRALYRQLWLNESGILTHTWSADSASLFVIGCQTGIVYQLKPSTHFQVTNTFSTQHTYIYTCFFNYESEQLIAVSYNSSGLLVISINQHNLTTIPLNFTPTKLRVDLSKRYFTVFNHNNLSLFQVASYCNDSYYYNLTLKQCLSCPTGCQNCDGFSCFRCSSGYHFNQRYTGCVGNTNEGSNASQIIEEITKKTLNVINSTMRVAGHRQFLSIFFQLFSNFDHFLLYVYHNRTYGPNMNMILQQIHDTIDYRFQIISNDLCKTYLGLDIDQIPPSIDYKANYTFYNYIALEQNGEGFFESNMQYFLLNIPLILLTLIAYRIFYWVFGRYRFTVLLKKFTLWGIIVLLLLEGNIQFFFFSFIGDFLTYFSVDLGHRIFNFLTLVASFITLVLSTYGLFSLYLMYRTKSALLYDNCLGKHSSAMYYLTINGLFNICRGVFHRISVNQPQIQALLLLLVELCEFLLIRMWWKRKTFKSSFVTVLLLSGSISRSVFALSLALSSYIQMQTLDNLHVAIFLLNVLTFFASIIQGIVEAIAKIRKAMVFRVKNEYPLGSQSNQSIHNVLYAKPQDLSEISSNESSQFNTKSFGGFQFKRDESQKTKRSRFCKKNVSTVIKIINCANQKEQSSPSNLQVQSINLD